MTEQDSTYAISRSSYMAGTFAMEGRCDPGNRLKCAPRAFQLCGALVEDESEARAVDMGTESSATSNSGTNSSFSSRLNSGMRFLECLEGVDVLNGLNERLPFVVGFPAHDFDNEDLGVCEDVAG